MEDKKVSLLYKIIKGLVWLFYPKMKVMGIENLPEEACIRTIFFIGSAKRPNG